MSPSHVSNPIACLTDQPDCWLRVLYFALLAIAHIAITMRVGLRCLPYLRGDAGGGADGPAVRGPGQEDEPRAAGAAARPHQTLTEHVRPTLRRAAAAAFAAAASWCLFYVLLAVKTWALSPQHHDAILDSGLTFGMNACTVLTSIMLLQFYFAYSDVGPDSHSETLSIIARPSAWGFFFASVLSFEFVARFAVPGLGSEAKIALEQFAVLYGVAHAVALFLVGGRLDSSFITEHLGRTPFRGDTSPPLHRGGVAACYVYASIQPLYALFDDQRSVVPLVLVFFALLLKIWLLEWVLLLLAPRPGVEKPCALAAHAYELRRFASEDASSFERGFLRRHFPPEYARRVKERKLGYLGIDYVPMDPFKQHWLGLAESEGGFFIRRVSAGSDAMRKGLLPGDILIRVGGMPIGEHNRLSEMLAGREMHSRVEVVVLRRRGFEHAAATRADYREIPFELVLDDFSHLRPRRYLPHTAVRLGWKWLHNSNRHGVVCVPDSAGAEDTASHRVVTGLVSHMWRRRFEIPDRRMLRIVLDMLVPGERVSLFGHAAQVATEHLLATVDLDWEPGPEVAAGDEDVWVRATPPAARIVQARMDYADRFMAWPDEMTPDTPTMTDAPCGKVVALFDGRGELVLEYFTEGQEEQDVLTKLDKHVRRCRLESDDYLLYTGGLPEPDGEGRMGYRRGRFECVRRRPRAMN